MVYVGMDVHRKRTQVAILDEDGTEVLNRNVANDPAELNAILGVLEPGTPAVFEAAYGWGWLADLCDDLKLDAHMAHPLQCKAIAAARLKNDKVDARTLAQMLRANLLPEAWISPSRRSSASAITRSLRTCAINSFGKLRHGRLIGSGHARVRRVQPRLHRCFSAGLEATTQVRVE